MSIQERRAAAEQAIRDAKAALELARAQLKAVQTACAHPNLQKGYGRDISGVGYNWAKCNDCGLDGET